MQRQDEEAGSWQYHLPLRGTKNTGQEAGSWQHDLPLRGTNSTGFKSKVTISHPHMLKLPLRSTNSEETISHPHTLELPLRSTHVAGSKSKGSISHPHVHDLPLRSTNNTSSKSNQPISHPHNQTNQAKAKFASDSQNETAAPAAEARSYNPQVTAAAPPTGLKEEYRVVYTGITSELALPTYCIVDNNGNVVKGGMVLERAHPFTSRGDGKSEVVSAGTFSAPGKYPDSL